MTEEFTLVAVGDSVVWGQGLAHRDKFVNVVYDWLKNGKTSSPRGVEALPKDHIQARSGAIIGEENFDDDELENFEDGELDPFKRCPGLSRAARHEMPHSAPMIVEQIDAYPQTAFPGESVTLPAAEDVDVVVIDGGINDTGAPEALMPSTSWRELTIDTRRHNYERMTRLLKSVTDKFPNSTVVVTGYFPVFSWRSSLLEAASSLPDELDIDAHLPGLPIAGSIMLASWFTDKDEKIIGNAEYFHRRQLHQLRRAVSEFVADPKRSSAVVFAHPGYGDRNALYADDAWLFEADEEGDPNVARKRQQGCGDYGQDTFCDFANVAHPNVDGATAYAEAVYDVHERHHRPAMRNWLASLTDTGELTLREACERYGLDPRNGLRSCRSHAVVDCLEVTIETGDITVQSENLFDNVPIPDHIKNSLESYTNTVPAGIHSDIQLVLETADGSIENDLGYPHRLHFSKGECDVFVLDPYLDAPGRTLSLNEIKGITLKKEQRFDELIKALGRVIESQPIPISIPSSEVKEHVYMDWEVKRFELSINGVTVHEEVVGKILEGDDSWDASYPR